jgi:DNA-binding SARP family transcriptional activator
MVDPTPLAELLGGHRKAAGLTQRQLAGQAGISLGAVRDLEQGRTLRPRPGSLTGLAAALRLSPGQLAEPARATGDRGLRVEVLGPLAAWRDGLPVPLGPVRQRAVLGLLALHAGTSLHPAAIIDALWGEDPPPTAAAMVQAIISRIRRLMGGPPGGPARLPWDGSGYRFIPDGIGLDVTQFGELTAQADARLAAADAAGACELYEQALALWRGQQPLEGVEVLYAHHSVTKLGRWRGDVVIKYAGAAASAGRPEWVIPHLESLTARDPLDERAAAHLMLMLAATGRQSAALRLHQDLAGRLHREHGVRPGAELSAAHLRIVREQVPAGVRVGADHGWAAQRRVVPRQLPPAMPGFAGRAAELAALEHVARQAGDTMVIWAIGGTAGVGKTALALHWAHQVAGAFPDGHLHVSLRGSEPAGQPGPAAAMRLFLDSLGVPPERIPAGLDAQAALYRSLLAGGKMLIVLDDARDPQQVRPLLPGTPGCLVLITSRNQLTGLAAADGAHLLTLTAPHQDALAPFDRLNFPGAGVLRSGPSRLPRTVTAAAGQTGGAR